MKAIQTAILTDVNCNYSASGLWFPVYDKIKVLKPLSGDGIIFFSNENDCKNFLGISDD